MENKIIDAFIEAATHIFQEIGFPDLAVSKAGTNEKLPDIMANIGIAGDLQGYITLSADYDSSYRFVDKMLKNMGVESEEEGFGKFHKEALGEIVNQVCGRSVMILEKLDIDCSITPPAIIMGAHMSFNVQSMTIQDYREYSGAFGTLGLLIALKNNDKRY